jgi:ankyrin repeat protein
MVKEFVGKSHGNLKRIKELVAEVPNIVNASWDWGNGDWETGLGAASHMGRSDIADFLLENKARKDVFCAAMKGETHIIAASLAVDPAVAVLPGPHRITLLFHAGLGGNVEIAKMLKKHDDQALHAAVWFGHLEMTRWLIDNDTKDLNVKRRKMTALDLAIKDGHTEIADLLRDRGVKVTKV